MSNISKPEMIKEFDKTTRDYNNNKSIFEIKDFKRFLEIKRFISFKTNLNKMKKKELFDLLLEYRMILIKI